MQKATVPTAPMMDDQLMIFCKKGETVFISRSLLAIGTSKRIILISTIASFAIFVSFEAIGAKKPILCYNSANTIFGERCGD